MPTTRKNKAMGKGTSPKIKKNPASVASQVDKDTTMENQNSNHSHEGASSQKRRPVIKSVVTVAKKRRHGSGSSESTVRKVVTNSNEDEIGEDTREVAHFMEDDDNVSMDIDDGGQAAREFATDNEAEESSDSESDNSVGPTSDKSEDEKSEGE